MGDKHTADSFDAAIDAFNADRTPGPRAAMLHRLTAEYKTTKWTRRMLFELLVACEWDEDEARRMLESMANG